MEEAPSKIPALPKVVPKPPQGMSVVDLAAGGFGGACQLAVGHPFDTIKVKLQSMPVPKPGEPPMFTGPMDAVRKTIAQDGLVGGLYRGVLPPLATVVVFNAALFETRQRMEKLLSPSGAPLTIPQLFASGAGAGVVASLIASPTELIKCKLQADTGKYKGTLDVMQKVVQEEGALGMARGLPATLLREVPGNAIMFGLYGAMKGSMAEHYGCKESELGPGALVMAGGIAGSAYWGFMYPTDIIKSKIQVDNPKNPLYTGTIDAFVKVARAEGVAGLYRGFTPCMGRAVPANAACFLGFEVAKSVLGG